MQPAGSESGLNVAVSRSDQKMYRARDPGSVHCIWSTGILLRVCAPRAICMPPIYGYWYVYMYSQSIFRIQNSEYAFHSISVFSFDFQKHTTSYSDACFWKSTQNTHIRVECIFWILNSENWLKIHVQIYWFARITWICKFCTRSRKTIRTANSDIPEPAGFNVPGWYEDQYLFTAFCIRSTTYE